MNKILSVALFFFTNMLCQAQTNYPTQDAVHVFWQPDLKITKKDYQGAPTTNSEKMLQKYDIKALSSLGIWSILDVPKKKKDRYTKMEKVYFAPAFEKNTSVAVTDDSMAIAKENVFFDICEIEARLARMEINKFMDSTKATGTISLIYMTVKNKMEDDKAKLFHAYFKDVFAEKKEGAFEKWRGMIDKRLEETKMWATTPEECYRLMTGKPVAEGYMQAKNIPGPLFN